MEPVILGPAYDLPAIYVGYKWSINLIVYRDEAMTEPHNFEGETVELQTSGIIFTPNVNMTIVANAGLVELALTKTETERLRDRVSSIKWVLSVSEEAVAHGTIPVEELLP